MRDSRAAGSLEVLPGAVCYHGEGPVWDVRDEILHWVDLTRGTVHHLAAAAWTFDAYDTEITAIVPHVSGGLIATTSDGFAHLSGTDLRPISRILERNADVRMNDGGCDRAGRFLAGSMGYDAEPAVGILHRLELDGQVSTLLEGVTIPNGLDWSPDGSLFYFTDSAAGLITAYDYDQDTGAMVRPRTFLDFADVTGAPDGLTVDSEGNVWVAMWDGWQVRCYSPDSALLFELPLPVQRPTSVAFGGPGLRDLYITTSRYRLCAEALAAQPAAGSLLRYRSTAVGRPPSLCRADLTPITNAGSP